MYVYDNGGIEFECVSSGRWGRDYIFSKNMAETIKACMLSCAVIKLYCGDPLIDIYYEYHFTDGHFNYYMNYSPSNLKYRRMTHNTVRAKLRDSIKLYRDSRDDRFCKRTVDEFGLEFIKQGKIPVEASGDWLAYLDLGVDNLNRYMIQIKNNPECLYQSVK